VKKPPSIPGRLRVMKPNSTPARNDFIAVETTGGQLATPWPAPKVCLISNG